MDLARMLDRLALDGYRMTDEQPRSGVAGWRVADIGEFHGTMLQLAADSD